MMFFRYQLEKKKALDKSPHTYYTPESMRRFLRFIAVVCLSLDDGRCWFPR